MGKTLKQKIHHILYDKDGNLNLKIPLKLRWSYINKIRRHNYGRPFPTRNKEARQ